jgi:hypothetical protein
MNAKISWTDTDELTATVHLVTNVGTTRTFEVTNVKEFIDEYYEDKTRPVPKSPYWSENSVIATLSHYLKQIDDALKTPDALVKINEIMLELNTPKAVA